jgi:1,2-phenylacetyl-CoA epoxidase catalytic subunit
MTAANQADPAAIIDLLAVLAYGELSAFDRMAADARMAPTVELRAALSEMAAVEMGHYRKLVARISELGADPQQAMAPFVRADWRRTSIERSRSSSIRLPGIW